MSYIKTYTAAAFALFLLSPLVALPYLIWGIYERRRCAFFLFSLFLGFLAWLQVPLADLFRHSLTAYNYLGNPISCIFENSLSADYFIPFTSWLLINNGIPYQILRLFAVTESFFLLTIIFNYMIEKSPVEYTKAEVFIRFCILFLFFEFLKTTCGVRFGFALYQYVFALHLAFNKRSYILALLFALLSTQIHMSFMFFVPISLILFLVCTSRMKFIFVFGVFSLLMLTIIIKYGYLLGRRADWYFEGGNSISDDSISTITIYGFILLITVRLFLLPYVFLAIKYFDKLSYWCRMMIIWIGLTIIFMTNLTIMVRTTFVLSAIGIFFLLETESRTIISKQLITIILWCGIMTTLFNVVNYRTYILNSRYQYIAMPVAVILQNQYDKQWIIEHVNGNKIIDNQ